MECESSFVQDSLEKTHTHVCTHRILFFPLLNVVALLLFYPLLALSFLGHRHGSSTSPQLQLHPKVMRALGLAPTPSEFDKLVKLMDPHQKGSVRWTDFMSTLRWCLLPFKEFYVSLHYWSGVMICV